jgi:hypothetical protein
MGAGLLRDLLGLLLGLVTGMAAGALGIGAAAALRLGDRRLRMVLAGMLGTVSVAYGLAELAALR